jgi:hypothetical protein
MTRRCGALRRREARPGAFILAISCLLGAPWIRHPACFLPETQPGTLTYLVGRYGSRH